MWLPVVLGIELAEFFLSPKVDISDSKIVVARVDPNVAKLRLLSANIENESAMTGEAWAKKYDLAVVMNASMFHSDARSVGYMRVGKKENGDASNDKAIFAAPGHIYDRECDPVGLNKPAFIAQNIRMLGCNRNNVWAKSGKKWSTACIGQDKKGRLLFIHVRSPPDVHDLVDQLLVLPLDLQRLMYVEGGPEATLFVKGKPTRVGSYETGFREDDTNTEQWVLPNVIGATTP